MDATRRTLVVSTKSHRNAEAVVERQRERRDTAIQKAYLAGVGATEIAELTGLSRPYVHMIVRPVKVRS